MNWMLACAVLLLGFCTAFLLFELRRARSGYEQLYALLVKDRDLARAEIVTLRRALFPQLDRVVARSASDARPEGGGGPTPAKQPNSAAAPTLSNRVPWRLRFKQQVAVHNTQQRHLDKIAEGMTPQEKKA